MAETISNKVSDVTQELITQLSGKNQVFLKKVIDNVFSFVGLAGGVGTSTLVANVAKVLSNKKFSVLVIDFNICFPTQQIYMKIKQEVKKPDLVSLLAGENRLGECLEYKDKIAVLYANNRILFDKVSLDTSISSNNLTKLLEQVSSLFDVVLLDIPSCGSLDYELTNTALYKSDYIITVMDENVSCIGALNRLERNMAYVGIPTHHIKLIMNKRTNLNYPKNVFSALNINLELLLPYEITVIEAGLRGQLYVEKGASSSVTSAQFIEGITDLGKYILNLGGYKENENYIEELNT